MNRVFTSEPNINTMIEQVDVSYVGIVVAECRTAYFVWSSSLDEIMCYFKNGLHIGDWIQFWIRSVSNFGFSLSY